MSMLMVRKVINIKEQPITTNSGMKLIRRVTTISLAGQPKAEGSQAR